MNLKKSNKNYIIWKRRSRKLIVTMLMIIDAKTKKMLSRSVDAEHLNIFAIVIIKLKIGCFYVLVFSVRFDIIK